MAALTQDRNTLRREADLFEFPVAANTVLYTGGIGCINSSGYAVPGAATATLKAIGRIEEQANNTGGVAGAMRAKFRRGCFCFANSSAADLIAITDIGANCYIVDDQTVAKTNGGSTRPVAGVIRDVEPKGVWVEF
jgi:hypothetical protein